MANNPFKLKNKLHSRYEEHPFHLLDPSPWPFSLSLSLFGLVLNTLVWFKTGTFAHPCPYSYPIVYSIFTTGMILF